MSFLLRVMPCISGKKHKSQKNKNTKKGNLDGRDVTSRKSWEEINKKDQVVKIGRSRMNFNQYRVRTTSFDASTVDPDELYDVSLDD